MGKKIGADVTLTFEPKGHINSYKVDQFFAQLVYYIRITITKITVTGGPPHYITTHQGSFSVAYGKLF